MRGTPSRLATALADRYRIECELARAECPLCIWATTSATTGRSRSRCAQVPRWWPRRNGFGKPRS